MSQNDCIGKTLKPWPILVDHYKSAYFGSDKCIAKILGSSSDARVKIEQKSIVEGQFNNEWNVLTFGMSASKPVLNTIGVTV
ncbi:hypothetical protein [Vibrio cholerae]|uniref:hypothetical protein n=1 Tax=Vibrio cholerae TaxID=666 RepID=UPI001F3ED002|nr:hypothetical protein [Vibrio cholerae]